MNGYEWITLGIAVVMLILAEWVARLPLRWFQGFSWGRVVATAALFGGLFMAFNMLVVVGLIFSGAAAPGADQVHDWLWGVAYLWALWYVVRIFLCPKIRAARAGEEQ